MTMQPNESSWALAHFQEALNEVRGEYIRPSVLFKPALTRHKDNQLWVASYGDLGVMGASPDEAMRNFDRAWAFKDR